MTACANNNEGKAFSGKKAVSATLAGVLAVGMVPAAALATEAPADGADEAGIDLLVVSDKAFEQAKVVSVTDHAGNVIEPEKGAIKLPFTGGPNYIESVKLELADGHETVVEVEDGGDYKFYFKKGSEAGAIIDANEVQAAAGYGLVIEYVGEGEYNGQKNRFDFSIDLEESAVDAELKMATSADASATSSDIVFSNISANDAFDATFDKIGDMVLYVNGEKKTYSSPKVYKVSDTSASGQLNTQKLYAGDYVAVLTYDTSKTATVKFTVAPYDLSEATASAKAVDSAPNSLSNVDYTIAGLAADMEDLFAVSYDLGKNDNVPQASIGTNDFGEYIFTISLASKAAIDSATSSTMTDADYAKLKESVTGSKDVAVKFVDDVVTIEYDNQDFQDGVQAKYIIGSGTMFSANEVTFTYGSSQHPDKKLCSVTVTNEAGEVVTDWATVPGKYTVVAEVTDPEYALGGVEVDTFETAYDAVDTDEGVYVRFGGQLTDEITKTYNGEDAIGSIDVKVVNGDKTMVEGTDYKVVYKDAKGKEVTEIVDAGNYTLTVEPVTFAWKNTVNNTVSITVNAIQATAIRVADQVTVNGVTGLAYTGEAVTPVIEYTTEKLVSGKVPEDAEWNVLPADTYTLSYGYDKDYVVGGTGAANYKAVEEVIEVGAYKASVYMNVSVVNYSVKGVNTTEFNVIDAKRFLDVPANAWYAEFVDEAYTQNYMSGYAGTKFFGPEDSIKRGDVCIVLARMAGEKLGLDENAGSDIGYYETPFSDVDGHYYYAEAIAWAAKTGIVTGDEGLGTFRPEDTVTREEFATMLMRYAQKAGTDVSADAAAELGKYSDGDQVSDWAKAAVAWASSDEIMTGHADSGLMDPAGDVTRAQVAKMIVTYQPKALVTPTVTR